MSSTLERLEKTESQAAAATAQLAKLQQDLGSLRESVGSSLQGISKEMQDQSQSTIQYLQFLLQKQMGLEQSVTSLGKMITAFAAELVDKNVTSNQAIMTRLRHADERGEKERIQAMVQSGAISAKEEVSGVSTVALYQEVITVENQTELLSEYRVVDLSSQNFPEDIRASFVGKKVGESVETADNGGKLVSKILEIYELATGERQGEVQEEPKEGSTENTATA